MAFVPQQRNMKLQGSYRWRAAAWTQRLLLLYLGPNPGVWLATERVFSLFMSPSFLFFFCLSACTFYRTTLTWLRLSRFSQGFKWEFGISRLKGVVWIKGRGFLKASTQRHRVCRELQHQWPQSWDGVWPRDPRGTEVNTPGAADRVVVLL